MYYSNISVHENNGLDQGVTMNGIKLQYYLIILDVFVLSFSILEKFGMIHRIRCVNDSPVIEGRISIPSQIQIRLSIYPLLYQYIPD